jgi:dienelactone hydrolase
MTWLKRLAATAIVILAAFGAYQLWPQSDEVVNVFYATSFEGAPIGVVGFPSFNAKNGKYFLPDATPVQQTAGGTLVMPDDASPTNKVPAMVILHGSGGAWGGRSVNLAMHLARNGIAGLAVDTFTSRNLRKTDDYIERLEKAPIHTQMADALSALLELQKHPHIDSSRIGVTGFSLGAATTLYMMFEPVIEHVLGPNGPRFSAYAMFYGGCSLDFEDFRVEGSPLLMMMGEKDESMSIPDCENFRERLTGMGVDVELIVYPGAGHGWDNPYPQHFVEGAVVSRNCLMLWKKDGEIIEANSGNSMENPLSAFRAMSGCADRSGYTMGFNEVAYNGSRNDILHFLRTTWGL